MTKLLRAANLPDREKSDCVQKQQQHLNLALTERSFYKESCKEASDTSGNRETTVLSETHAPCLNPGALPKQPDAAWPHLL